MTPATGDPAARTKRAARRTRPAGRTRAAAPARARAGGRGTAAAPPRMPFVLLILGLLGGALISLLALRTILIEDAFAISTLQEENAELANQEEALREEVLHAESPDRIAEEAEALGMEQGDAPATLDLETGEFGGADDSAADE
ncbi:hypothetical protein [Nocardiopsis trehalosi]|jgi:hypothetical protein|uniref:hypothetical protein n=1 Tax=Nocardiopsis trehalosi TaxID=109329 RepID=UPI000833C32D|nr:hypothetical protein [Nocardiopsis trehalosi]